MIDINNQQKRRIFPSERVVLEIPPKLVSEAKSFNKILKLLTGEFAAWLPEHSAADCSSEGWLFCDTLPIC